MAAKSKERFHVLKHPLFLMVVIQRWSLESDGVKTRHQLKKLSRHRMG